MGPRRRMKWKGYVAWGECAEEASTGLGSAGGMERRIRTDNETSGMPGEAAVGGESQLPAGLSLCCNNSH